VLELFKSSKTTSDKETFHFLFLNFFFFFQLFFFLSQKKSRSQPCFYNPLVSHLNIPVCNSIGHINKKRSMQNVQKEQAKKNRGKTLSSLKKKDPRGLLILPNTAYN